MMVFIYHYILNRMNSLGMVLYIFCRQSSHPGLWMVG